MEQHIWSPQILIVKQQFSKHEIRADDDKGRRTITFLLKSEDFICGLNNHNKFSQNRR